MIVTDGAVRHRFKIIGTLVFACTIGAGYSKVDRVSESNIECKRDTKSKDVRKYVFQKQSDKKQKIYKKTLPKGINKTKLNSQMNIIKI